MFQHILFACSIFLVFKFTRLSIVWIVLQIAAMMKIIIWMMNANNVRLMISKFWNFGLYKLCIIKLVRMKLFFMSQQHYNNVLSCLSGLSILSTIAKFLNMFYSHIAFCCVSCKIASRPNFFGTNSNNLKASSEVHLVVQPNLVIFESFFIWYKYKQFHVFR